jgi:hypothetical protein
MQYERLLYVLSLQHNKDAFALQANITISEGEDKVVVANLAGGMAKMMDIEKDTLMVITERSQFWLHISCFVSKFNPSLLTISYVSGVKR